MDDYDLSPYEILPDDGRRDTWWLMPAAIGMCAVIGLFVAIVVVSLISAD